jgi:hypothetical protein
MFGMEKMSRPTRIVIVLIGLIAATGVLLLVLLTHRHHALGSGKLTTYMGVLVSYAHDHGGWYPRGEVTPLLSLQKLYPQYDQWGSGLAGLSGDEKTVERLAKEGRPIDSTVSSWVYFPGFRSDDDPNICIIWERQEGVFLTGSRADGHAVGFADGGFNQIPSKDWPAFVKHQEELRRNTLLKRATNGGDFSRELQWNAEQSRPSMDIPNVGEKLNK